MPASAQPPRRRGRLLALAAVLVVVVLAHAWVTSRVMVHLQALSQDQAAQIERMQATLVADMQLTEPPVVSMPPPSPATAPRVAEASLAAASAASVPASRPRTSRRAADAPSAASAPDSTGVASGVDLAASSPASQEDVAAAVFSDDPLAPLAASAPASAAGPSQPPFEWPLATRVTFKLEGYVRGPVYGDAMVEWVRQDQRYQVHVDASIGPRFAPLGSQRWTSEGLITPQGLRPRRFEAVNKLLIKSNSPKVVLLEDDEVVLSEGQRLPRLPGVQDPASHYIQMAYEFMLKPETLRVGTTVSIPLARTRHQEMIVYDIVGEELLDTPLGKVNTFRMKPRPLTDQKNDLLGEVWIAPSLQYLPIRMLVRQGSTNYLDMRMSRAPQQSSSAASAAVAPAPIKAQPRIRAIEQLPVPP